MLVMTTSSNSPLADQRRSRAKQYLCQVENHRPTVGDASCCLSSSRKVWQLAQASSPASISAVSSLSVPAAHS